MKHFGLQGRSGWVVGLLLLLAALQTAYNARIPLMGDEAYYWSWSRHLALSYFDHPPMIAWLLRLTTTGATNELAVRLVPVGCFTATAWLIWRLAQETAGDRAAALSLVIFLAMPATHIGAFAAVPDAPLMLFWTVALYTGHRMLQSDALRWPLLTGLAIGLALLSKYTAILFPAQLLLFLAVWRRDKLTQGRNWLAAPVALAVFSPVLIWNAEHDWVSFAFQYRHGADEGHGIDWREWAGFVGGTFAVFSPVLLGVALMAATRALRNGSESRRYLAVACLFPLAFFAWKGLFRKVELNWVAIAFPAATILAGAYLAERRLIRTAVFGLVLALLLTAIVKFPLAFGLPAKLNPFNRFYSNQAVVEALLSFRRDGEPLLADHYTTASLLSFYSPDHPVVTIPTTTRPSQYDIRDEKPAGVRPHGLYLTSTRQGGSLSCSELEWKCGGALFLKTLTLQAPGFQPRTFRFYRCGS